MKLFSRIALGAGVLVAATSSHAAIDVSSATAALAEIGPAVATVFGALILVVAAIKGYKFVTSFVKGG